MIKLAQIQKPKIRHKHPAPRTAVGSLDFIKADRKISSNEIFHRVLLDMMFLINDPIRENRGVASRAIKWTLGAKYASEPYFWHYMSSSELEGNSPRYNGYCTYAQLLEMNYWAARINWTLGYESGLYLEAYGEWDSLEGQEYYALEQKWIEKLINLYGPMRSDLRIKR